MQNLDPAPIRRLLVRQTNWIGDAVMTTPAMGAIRATFPRAEIVVAANPLVAELFRCHPCCDRVLVYERSKRFKGIPSVLQFAGQLRSERFDLAILLQNAIEAALLTALAGIPRRLGYRTDGRGLLLTHGVPIGEQERRLHHTEYYLRLLEQAGIRGGDRRLRLHCTEAERAWARQTLGAGTWLAINPGAAYGSAKRWIPGRFAAVADRLVDEFGLKVLLTGGPGETEIGRDIEKAMRHAPLNVIGRTNVRQLMALLAGCRLMVTNDSGPMHVAAAFGVPIVAVFGPTDHTTTSPLGDSCRIVREAADCAPCLLRQCPTDHRCMEAITAEAVLRQARELLGSAA